MPEVPSKRAQVFLRQTFEESLGDRVETANVEGRLVAVECAEEWTFEARPVDERRHSEACRSHELAPRVLCVDGGAKALFAPSEEASHRPRDRAVRLRADPIRLDITEPVLVDDAPSELEQIAMLGRGARSLTVEHEHFEIAKHA